MRIKNPYLASFLIVLGLIIFLNPFKTLEFLMSIIAFGILLWGVNSLIAYKVVNKPFLVTQGILNIVFAILLLLSLNLAVKSVAFFIGIYVIFMSVLRFFNGFRLKKYNIVGYEKQIISSLLMFVLGLYIALFPAFFPMIIGALLIGIGLSMVIR